MIWILLFIFGLIIGSFLNVVILRYDENRPLLSPAVVGGRSKCMTCQVGLKWYELVPLFSFLAQGAKCRHCKHSLNWQYPAVEFITAFLTVAIPFFLFDQYGAAAMALRQHTLGWFYVVCGLWLVAAYTTVVLSAIDLRLRIIPDQCNILLGIIGIIMLLLKYSGILAAGNFTGAYAAVLGAPQNIFLSALIGVVFATILFGGTILFTRGRGMGMGDFKLAIPLGLLLGWPDILVAFIAAFVIGSIVGLLLIANRRTTMKGMVPFGPFMVIGLYVAMFYGESLLRWYFSLI